MFSYKVLYRCKNCGFEKVFIIGDNLTIGDVFKICPKCKSKMYKEKFIGKN